MALACSAEKKLEKKLNQIITDAGFNPKKIKYMSFHELEESLSINHYNLTGRHRERSGHLLISPTSNKEIEEKFKHSIK